MAMTDAQKRANAKWNKANTDMIAARCPKGTKAKVQALSTMAGQSVSAYILQAIKERCARDGIEWDTLDNPPQP